MSKMELGRIETIRLNMPLWPLLWQVDRFAIARAVGADLRVCPGLVYTSPRGRHAGLPLH